MKKVLWSTILLLGLFGMYSCNEEIIPTSEVNEQQQDLETLFTGDDVIPGQLIIKLAKEPAEVKVVQTRSGESQIETGLKTIDEICASIGALSMRRVFPPAGKFEARTREAGLHLWYVVEFPEEINLTRAASDFNNSEDIAIVETVHLITLPVKDIIVAEDSNIISQHTTTRNYSFNLDPKRSSQWHYKNPSGNDINLYKSWSETVGHPDIIVAVLDGGIQYDHEDLKDNMWINEREIPSNGIDDDNNGYVDDYYGYNFYDRSHNIVAGDHATHVAGIIGAINYNRLGISGIAGGDKVQNKKGVRLMNCQILNPSTGRGTSDYNLAEAIRYAADNGAIIAQNSWGYLTANYFPNILKEAIDYFISNAGINNGVQTGPMRGGIFIASAGNTENESKHYPAAYSEVIAVTAIGPDGKKAPYSTYGSWTDIAAPGGNLKISNGGIFSTIAGGRYGYMEGTSMACPHVSGIAALVLSKAVMNGTSYLMTPEVLKERLFLACNQSTLNYYNPGVNLGKGLIDASIAVGINSFGYPTTEPTIIGPDELVEGEWGTFRVSWPNFRPRGDYTFEWEGISFVDIEPTEDNMRVSARGFDEGGWGEISLTIKGKYNGYYNQISKQFDVIEKEGDFCRLKVEVVRGGPIDFKFTLHNANINNKWLPSGYGNGEYGAHLAPGHYRFKIDCLSTPGQSLPFDNMYIDTQMTTYGAHLTVEIEQFGIRVIDFRNHSPSQPNIYRWFFEEGEI